MRDKYGKTDIKLKHSSMNIFVYRARQKILGIWYYIGEDRLYRKSMTQFDDEGSGSHRSLAILSTASGYYDNLYRKERSHRCTKGKTYGGALCFKDLAMVFHPPLPGGCIQGGRLVLHRRNPPSRGRVYLRLHG
jgi:hypothetical protein